MFNNKNSYLFGALLAWRFSTAYIIADENYICMGNYTKLQKNLLVDFGISKTSWTKLRHMVNKPFWHISDFVLASYTYDFFILIGSVASKTVISMLTTVRVKKGQKPLKTLNWRHCSMRIRAKRKKSLLQHWELPAKPFLSDCMRWEWFKNKELWFLMIWSQGTLSVLFSPVNNCFSGKKGRGFFIA